MKEKNIFGLVEYNRQDFFDESTDEIRFADRFYIMTEADAVLKGQQELIAEKDKEIARQNTEIKEAVKTMKSLEAEIMKLKEENVQLKKETEFMHSNCKWDAGNGCHRLLGEKLAIIDENVKLKRKLENVQASMYADVVDANMEVRRLKRALYKVCANWAHFAVAFFSSYATKERWHNMEIKCLKKAEEYK